MTTGQSWVAGRQRRGTCVFLHCLLLLRASSSDAGEPWAAGPRGRRCFPGGVCGPGLSPPASLPCTGLWPPLCSAASNVLCAWRRRDLACKRYCLSKIKKQVFIWDAEKISCRHSQLILWLWSHPSSHAFFILNHLALVCIWTAEITGKLNLREVMSWHQYIWQNKLFSAKLWNQ